MKLDKTCKTCIYMHFAFIPFFTNDNSADNCADSSDDPDTSGSTVSRWYRLSWISCTENFQTKKFNNQAPRETPDNMWII